MGKILADFIASEPKAAEKMEHAVQDYRHTGKDLAHALEDLTHEFRTEVEPGAGDLRYLHSFF